MQLHRAACGSTRGAGERSTGTALVAGLPASLWPLVTWSCFLWFVVGTIEEVLKVMVGATPKKKAAAFAWLAWHLSPCGLPPALSHFG